MNNKNKKSIIILFLSLFVIIGGYIAYNKFYFKTEEIILPAPSSPDETNASTSTADTYSVLMNKALAYKFEGDAGNKAAYDSAISVFKELIKKTEGEYWLPHLNLANTYRSIGNFTEAEDAYLEAQRISGGGEIVVYQARIDSWQMDPTKKPEEIKKLFQEAIKNVMENVNLIKSYAGYLRDRGDKAEAIEQFEILAEKFPDNRAYRDEIELLRK